MPLIGNINNAWMVFFMLIMVPSIVGIVFGIFHLGDPPLDLLVVEYNIP